MIVIAVIAAIVGCRVKRRAQLEKKKHRYAAVLNRTETGVENGVQNGRQNDSQNGGQDGDHNEVQNGDRNETHNESRTPLTT